MNDELRAPTDERDDVARLLRLAGKRRAVPRERTERVRAAARAEWRSQVQGRKRGRRAWTAAGLAVAASLTLLVTMKLLPIGIGTAGSAEAAILVEAVAGPVWSANGAQERSLVPGDALETGGALTTMVDGRVAIRMASGHSVRLDASSKIRLLDRGALALERGAVYVDSGAESATTDSLEIHTPLGIVREIGTQFEVRLEDESVRVRLREGAVVVDGDDRRHEVRAGTELTMGADGFARTRAIPIHGPGWDWIVDVTPRFDLEGLTARAFLDRVARERGWTLSFADAELARSAEEIVLAGTVEHLTLEQSLEAVLPTCRMTHRLDDGVLRIEPAP